MKINERFLWAINCYGGDGISGICITCGDNKEEIANFFQSTFNKLWEVAEGQVEQKHGNCINRDEGYDFPVTTKITSYGVQVRINNLCLKYDNGEEQIDYDWPGEKALENTLNALKEKYPDVSYDGYVGYVYSDSSSGDIMEYDISSHTSGNHAEPFDFIGESIADAIEDDFFWDKLEEELEDQDLQDITEIRDIFQQYKGWISQDGFDRLDEIIGE